MHSKTPFSLGMKKNSVCDFACKNHLVALIRGPDFGKSFASKSTEQGSLYLLLKICIQADYCHVSFYTKAQALGKASFSVKLTSS